MLIFFQQNIVLFFQEALYRKMTSGPKENGFGGNPQLVDHSGTIRFNLTLIQKNKKQKNVFLVLS